MPRGEVGTRGTFLLRILPRGVPAASSASPQWLLQATDNAQSFVTVAIPPRHCPARGVLGSIPGGRARWSHRLPSSLTGVSSGRWVHSCCGAVPVLGGWSLLSDDWGHWHRLRPYPGGVRATGDAEPVGVSLGRPASPCPRPPWDTRTGSFGLSQLWWRELLGPRFPGRRRWGLAGHRERWLAVARPTRAHAALVLCAQACAVRLRGARVCLCTRAQMLLCAGVRRCVRAGLLPAPRALTHKCPRVWPPLRARPGVRAWHVAHTRARGPPVPARGPRACAQPRAGCERAGRPARGTGCVQGRGGRACPACARVHDPARVFGAPGAGSRPGSPSRARSAPPPPELAERDGTRRPAAPPVLPGRAAPAGLRQLSLGARGGPGKCGGRRAVPPRPPGSPWMCRSWPGPSRSCSRGKGERRAAGPAAPPGAARSRSEVGSVGRVGAAGGGSGRPRAPAPRRSRDGARPSAGPRRGRPAPVGARGNLERGLAARGPAGSGAGRRGAAGRAERSGLAALPARPPRSHPLPRPHAAAALRAPGRGGGGTAPAAPLLCPPGEAPAAPGGEGWAGAGCSGPLGRQPRLQAAPLLPGRGVLDREQRSGGSYCPGPSDTVAAGLSPPPALLVQAPGHLEPSYPGPVVVYAGLRRPPCGLCTQLALAGR